MASHGGPDSNKGMQKVAISALHIMGLPPLQPGETRRMTISPRLRTKHVTETALVKQNGSLVGMTRGLK